MECELCGRRVDKLYEAKIEGALLRVCRECAGHGDILRRVQLKESGEREYEFIDGYGRVIREKRKEKGLSISELARMVGVKKEILKKIEEEKIYPSARVADSLEEVLGIKIREESEKISVKSDFTVTLGDVVRVK